MKKNSILVEQTDWSELSAEEKRLITGWPANRIIAYFSRQTPPYEVKKFRNNLGREIWKKRLKGAASSTTPTPSPTTDLSKYVGEYEGQSILPNFKIKENNGKLFFIKELLGQEVDMELTFVSDNVFKGKLATVNYEVNFTEVNGVVTGGQVNVGGKTVAFTKKTSGSSSSTTSDDEFQWKEVPKAAWEALKKAGKWVKQEGTKFLAYLNSQGEAVEDQEVWECVNKVHKVFNWYPLSESSSGEFMFTRIDYKVNGRDTKLELYKNNDAFLKYNGTNEIVPGGRGKWGCGTGDIPSYWVKWENGNVAVWGGGPYSPSVGSEPNSENSTGGGTSSASNLPSYKSACPNTKGCPKLDDVKAGKASFKICMKCDDIKNIQDMPSFQRLYYKILKDNGKQEKSDGIFGPMMKQAVENFQESRGLKKDGVIGIQTYTKLLEENPVAENFNLKKTIKKTIKETKIIKEEKDIKTKILSARLKNILENYSNFENYNETKKIKIGFKFLKETYELKKNEILTENLMDIFKGLYGKSFDTLSGQISEPLLSSIFEKIGLDENLKNNTLNNIKNKMSELISNMSNCQTLSKFISDVVMEEFMKKLDNEKISTSEIINTSLMDAVDDEMFRRNLNTKLEKQICELYDKFTENAKNLVVRMSSL